MWGLDAIKHFFIKIGIVTFWKGCIKTISLNGSSYLPSMFPDTEKIPKILGQETEGSGDGERKGKADWPKAQ